VAVGFYYLKKTFYQII